MVAVGDDSVVQRRTGIYINGAWVASSSDETIDVENPATEQLIASVPSATAADVDAAVTAARAALPRWWQTTVAERAGHLRRIRDGPEAPGRDRRDHRERDGLPAADRDEDPGGTAADRAGRVRRPDRVRRVRHPRRQHHRRAGACGRGRCDHGVELLLFDVLHEADLPAGVANLVPGYGPRVGEAIAGHPAVCPSA